MLLQTLKAAVDGLEGRQHPLQPGDPSRFFILLLDKGGGQCGGGGRLRACLNGKINWGETNTNFRDTSYPMPRGHVCR